MNNRINVLKTKNSLEIISPLRHEIHLQSTYDMYILTILICI